MRKPFDLDEEDDFWDGVQHPENAAPENSINDSENLAIEADSTSAAALAIDFDSINNQNEAAQQQDDFDDDDDAPTARMTTPTVAPLASKLADRPVTKTMRSRYDGHAPVNDQVRADWMKIIEQDPFNFEALLYRPKEPIPTEIDQDGIEVPLFTEINNNQQELDYEDPVTVTVIDCPDQRESFQVVDADGDQDGLTDDFLIIKAATTGVTMGSIFEWNEELMNGDVARRWWYVLRIYSYGTASVGSLYYCIPARNIQESAEEVQHVQQ
ncbi:TPA: phage tail protein [Enterobacter hormaechei subsp. xiangfangensis]|nr:phage tail protein [Enterobacter hormaechei subsp. xiangfangensis]